MSARSEIETKRLVRVLTAAVAIGSSMLVFFHYRSPLESLQATLAERESQLQSDDVMFAEVARLRAERPHLAARYASVFSDNAQANFLRDLARTLHHHDVWLAGTSSGRGTDSDTRPGYRSAFAADRLELEIRGSYRGIVGAIDELSAGSQLVSVEAASLHRDGRELVAQVPIVLYEPSRPMPGAASDTGSGE